MNHSNQLTIKFGGDGNIKLDTLTDFLEDYKDLLFLINSELGYKSDDLNIEVSPPENGSFKIKIKSKYKDLILEKIGDLTVGTLVGLILLFASMKKSDESLEEIEKILKEQKSLNKDVPKNCI